MKKRIMYIEHKADQSDRGDAWIGEVEFSKTGKTIYFNEMAFKRGGEYSGNHYDLETGEDYWISGVKKNGQDRHWAGGGKIMIDKNVIEDYLKIVDFDALDENSFEVVEIPKTDKQKFKKLENQ